MSTKLGRKREHSTYFEPTKRKAFFLKFLLQCFLPDHSCGQESARSDNIRLDIKGFIDCSASLKNSSLLIIPSPVV
jgi:hypothetical protein